MYIDDASKGEVGGSPKAEFQSQEDMGGLVRHYDNKQVIEKRP